MLTVEDTFVISLLGVSVIPLRPESFILQPERCPYCVEHTQAARQAHAGLRNPEATDGVPELQQLHICTPLWKRQRGRENTE